MPKRKYLFTAIASLLLTASFAHANEQDDANNTPPSQPAPSNAKDEAIAAAKALISNEFKDPASAQYRNIVVYNNGGTKAVCGEVNAKNSYGGYAGYQMFYAFILPGNEAIMPGVGQVAVTMCSKQTGKPE